MAIKIDTHLDFEGRVDPADADYPWGKYKEKVGDVPRTGTPFKASGMNDLVGFGASILNEVGVVPNGTPDSVNNTQYLDALKDIVGALSVDGSHSGIGVAYTGGTINLTLGGALSTPMELSSSTSLSLSGSPLTLNGVTFPDVVGTVGQVLSLDSGLGFEWADMPDVGLSQEEVQDVTAAMLTGGTHTGVTVAYDDPGGVINLTVTATGGGLEYSDIDAMVNGNTESGGISVDFDDISNKLNFVIDSMDDYADTGTSGKIVRIFDEGSNTVFGYGAVTTGFSTAIGAAAVCSGAASVALGYDTVAANNAASLGSQATSEEYAVCVGSATSAGAHSVTVGALAGKAGVGYRLSQGSVSIGSGAGVTGGGDAGDYNVFVGYDSGGVAGVAYSVGVGNRANPLGDNSIAIGSNATSQENETVIGNDSTVMSWVRGHIVAGPFGSSGNTPTGGSSTLVLSNQSSDVTAVAPNTISAYSKDISPGNTTLALYTEGSPVTTETPPTGDSTVQIVVNGVTYKLHATVVV